MATKNGTTKLQFNVVVMGDQYCGKTSIVERLINDRYGSNYVQTIGSEFYKKDICYNDQNVLLRVFDTAGQETMKTVIRSVYRKAQGIMLVFDYTRPKTLLHINDWIDLIEMNCDVMPEVILVGNKVDLHRSQRKVTHSDAIQTAERHNIKYFAASAKKNLNIDKAFTTLTSQIIKHSKRLFPDNLNDSIQIHRTKEKEKTGCCGVGDG